MFMSSYSLPWPRAPHCSRASRVHHPPSLPGRGRDDSACRICLFVCLPCCLAALTAAVSAPNDLSPSPSCRCYHVCSGTMSSSLLSFSAPRAAGRGRRRRPISAVGTTRVLFSSHSVGGQIEIQTDRETDRQTDRQADHLLPPSLPTCSLVFTCVHVTPLCSARPAAAAIERRPPAVGWTVGVGRPRRRECSAKSLAS